MTTTGSLEEAIRVGYDVLHSLGLDVTQTAPDTVEATGGSKLMTYWMGLYRPASSMPVKVVYTVTDQGHSRLVSIHTRSSFLPTFYLFWKFDARANQVTDDLLYGLSLRLPQPATSA
jgi:hypothetical protein